MESVQIGLPYPEITALQKREVVKKNIKRGQETFFVPFHKIQVRDGFNVRKVYNGIDELAMLILAQGLITPLTVDVAIEKSPSLIKDAVNEESVIYLERGHRRIKAISLILQADNKDILFGMPGFQNDGEGNLLIECFVNKAEVDELTRLMRQVSSNSAESYTALEVAEVCLRMKTYFQVENKDIATKLGLSRQTVENMLILANQSDSVKQAVSDGKLSATAAVELARRITNQQDRDEYVEKKLSSGETIKVRDAKELAPDDTDEDDGIKGKLNTDKLEVIMCNEVIGSLDKIFAIFKRLTPGELSEEAVSQIKMDVEHQIDMDQKKMATIREYVNKCTK